MRKSIFRNVYLLGLLSLFNDFTSEMITPLLPVYLATLGLGPGFLGLMEGLANFLSYLTMLFSGMYADRFGENKKTTVLGYRICAFLRPLIAVPVWGVILFARWVDRIGKGIRTAPRDRLITASVEKKDWGRAFGIHRMMDHAGSLLGAGTAALVLALFSEKLPFLFLFASLPAILSILILPRMIQEMPVKLKSTPTRLSWELLPPPLRPYVLIIFLSALSTPSELFLIFKMKDLGMPLYQIPLIWILLSVFKLVSAYAGGHLADRWSRRGTLGVGWTFFAATYLGFAFNQGLALSWLLVAFFGFQSGLIEASERAYPATIAQEEARATALGWFYFANGLGLLPGSILFGVIWKQWGSPTAFLIFAAMTLLTVPLLTLLPSDRALRKSAPPA